MVLPEPLGLRSPNASGRLSDVPTLRRRRRAEIPGGGLPPVTQNFGARRRRRRPSLLKGIARLFRALFSLHGLRSAALWLLAIGVCATAVYGGFKAYRNAATRDIRICVVTDFSFRDQKPNWEYQLKLWFAEVNRIFEPAGVRWDLNYGGESYPEGTAGSLETRRAWIAETTTCRADVVMGFTGYRDSDANTSVSPFAHAGIIAATAKDSDAMVVTVIARALARLFAVPVTTNTLISIDAPQDGILDAASLKLIEGLRQYDFSSGIDALPGKWEGRAAQILVSALAGKVQTPAAEAHRTLGRAFVGALKHPQAIAQFREAVRADPRDALLRFELALELNADAQHDAAISELRQAARLDPEDGRPHAALGAILVNLQRPAEAIDELRTAVRLDPRNPDYQTLLGNALAPQVGGAHEAAKAFEAALRARPRDEAAIIGLAQVSAVPQATRDLVAEREANVRQNPSSSAAHLQLGIALARAVENEAARKELLRSVELDPRNGQAHLAVAQMDYMAGEFAKAETELKAARAAGAEPSLEFIDLLGRKLKP
jgi:Tfp pilus assembly protein PilF